MWEELDIVKKHALWERFWSKVKPVDSGCWEWQAGMYPNGYGMFGLSKGVVRCAHRVAWQLANGAIPDGIEICHQCDNRRCSRPQHLFLGTRIENMQDMVAKRRGKHSNRWLWRGSTYSLTELYEAFSPQWPSVSKTTFYARIKHWGVERAMTVPGRIK